MSDLPYWFQPPTNEIGAPSAMRVVFVASTTMGVWLEGFIAYSSGFEFKLKMAGNINGGSMLPSAQDRDDESKPKLTVAFGDGRRSEATVQGRNKPPPRSKPEIFLGRGGGWAMSSYLLEGFWVCPLPPDPKLDFTFIWDAEGLSISREVGATELLGPGQVIQLWPVETE